MYSPFHLTVVISPQGAPAVCACSTAIRIGRQSSVTKSMVVEFFGAAFAADGRLVTSSFDGKIRLYDPNFALSPTHIATSGHYPAALAFSPDGKSLAVGHFKEPLVELLDGHSMKQLPRPNLEGLNNIGDLFLVAWPRDGQTLLAASAYTSAYERTRTRDFPIFAWDQAGRGTRRAISAKCATYDSTTMSLVPLPAGRLFVDKGNPCFTMLKPDGEVL